MPASTVQTDVLWPLVLYFALVVALVAGVLAISHVLGERHRQRATGDPYECGLLPAQPARLRLSAEFYQVAVFFIIFDVEAMFLFTWAVAARQVGWTGYVEALIFVAVLLLGLAYLWRIGALDWGGTRSRFAQRGGGGKGSREQAAGSRQQERGEPGVSGGACDACKGGQGT